MKEKNETKELAIRQEGEFLLPSADLEIDTAELEGLSINFDTIKIPSGGSIAFEVSGENPESPDMVKELEAVIIDHYPINAYYESKYEGQNNPPSCSSYDGKMGVGNPSGNCKICVLNSYGSGEDGVGKACKNLHRLFILRNGDLLPTRLTLPPTSLKPFSDYLVKKVVMKGMKSCDLTTKITLKKETSKSGIVYAQAQFSVGRILGPQEKKVMREYAESMKNRTRMISKEDELLQEAENLANQFTQEEGPNPFMEQENK